MMSDSAQHRRFLQGMEECRTPGTWGYRRIEWAVACMNRERSWGRPWKSLGARNRTKLDTYRLMIHYFAEDGAEFTYHKAVQWLRAHARNYRASPHDVYSFLSHHRSDLGIHPVYKFNSNGPIVWSVDR